MGYHQWGSLPLTLRKVNVHIVSLPQCQSSYDQRSITARRTCAGVNGGGKDSCKVIMCLLQTIIDPQVNFSLNRAILEAHWLWMVCSTVSIRGVRAAHRPAIPESIQMWRHFALGLHLIWVENCFYFDENNFISFFLLLITFNEKLIQR